MPMSSHSAFARAINDLRAVLEAARNEIHHPGAYAAGTRGGSIVDAIDGALTRAKAVVRHPVEPSWPTQINALTARKLVDTIDFAELENMASELGMTAQRLGVAVEPAIAANAAFAVARQSMDEREIDAALRHLEDAQIDLAAISLNLRGLLEQLTARAGETLAAFDAVVREARS